MTGRRSLSLFQYSISAIEPAARRIPTRPVAISHFEDPRLPDLRRARACIELSIGRRARR